jgi:sulfite reductase (NADPH) hemoprotein beta-component
LVRERGTEAFRDEVEAEWEQLRDGPSTLTAAEVIRIEGRFTWPAYEQPQTAADNWRREKSGSYADVASQTQQASGANLATGAFAAWRKRNVHPHKQPGYAAVTLSLKKTGVPPGDVTAGQMDAIADLADRYSFGELRVSHEQNLVLADVREDRLEALWREAKLLGLATPNIGLLTNIISCPGGDFCALANAKSIPVAEAIQRLFDDLDYLHDIGELDLNISGCINSCGHHHVGHIGVLGVDKQGAEFYQITVGGNQGARGADARTVEAPASVGKVIGPAFAQHEVPWVVERLIETYLQLRESEEERFVDCVHRLGIEPFKENVYGDADSPRRQTEAATA